MTRLTLDWQVITALLAITTAIVAAALHALKTTAQSAIKLDRISRAVLGDGTPQNPSLGGQMTEMRREFADLSTAVHTVRADQVTQQDRLTVVEATERANSRAARHAIRNLQHQVGFLFGERKELPPPAPDDLFDL